MGCSSSGSASPTKSQNAAEIDQGAAPKIRDQERTLAERLISELSGTEFHPENYEDEYRKRVLKAIEQKIAGEEIQQIEVAARPPTTALVATPASRRVLDRKGAGESGTRRNQREDAGGRTQAAASGVKLQGSRGGLSFDHPVDTRQSSLQ